MGNREHGLLSASSSSSVRIPIWSSMAEVEDLPPFSFARISWVAIIYHYPYGLIRLIDVRKIPNLLFFYFFIFFNPVVLGNY